jgi:hypothetical protein
MAGPLVTLVLSALVFTAALTGMLGGQEPWATWFYPLAWYPTLAAVDACLSLKRGRGLFSADLRFTAALLAWSVPFWLLFELVNFRVANWYYVFLPPGMAARWTGIVLSFATVLPAIFASRELAAELGLAKDARWPRLPVTPVLPALLQGAGVAFVVLALAWPRFFFPLVWGAVTLLADPWVYRRDPDRSLLAALERGRPAVILQLLAGGLAIGFLWELYNVQARGKWIYTVPGLEELKLFEMPLLGFLGFPVLALDGWAVWNALGLVGLAPGLTPPASAEARDHGRRTALRPVLRGVGAASVLLACVGVLLGMERWTITSTRPELGAIVGPAAPVLAAAHHDVFTVSVADPLELARVSGADVADCRTWVQKARLATLRGIGTQGTEGLAAVGIDSVEGLARMDAAELTARLTASGADGVRPARVRVWVRAARRLGP